MTKRSLLPLALLVFAASTGLASWASPPASPAPAPAPAAGSPPSPPAPAPGGEKAFAPPAVRPLCSGFFFVACSRACTDGSQQNAFGSGCTCDAAKANCSSHLTCTGTTMFGPCDS